MHLLDYLVIGLYFVVVILIGYYFLKRQTKVDEYFVGNRNIGTAHIGLSVIATDVGGGFSIGLGGLGFTMGLSGSWLLFSGLIGAWLAAVILIPRVKPLGDKSGFLTFPDFLKNRYNKKVQVIAALISSVGYAGFVGSQILAGAKLTSAAFGFDFYLAICVMALVVILYTAFGGMEAVIATDIFQWGVLFIGLAFVALPLAWIKIGGCSALQASLPEQFFSLTNISFLKLLTWLLTIIPIWFVGMTLYQRIYAAKDVKTAKRAWYLAGLLEWPLMAFMGVLLGMFARVMFPHAEAEMGLPLLVRDILPIGVTGLVLAAYFSAIMSTADSCLLASVGNIVNDFYQNYISPKASAKAVLKLTRMLTIIIGILSVVVAVIIPKVLDAILISYSFMVGGLFAPTFLGILWKRATATAALWSMSTGFATILIFTITPIWKLDPIIIAIPASFLVMVVVSLLKKSPNSPNREE